MWAVTSCIWVVTACMYDVQALCRLLHSLILTLILSMKNVLNIRPETLTLLQ